MRRASKVRSRWNIEEKLQMQVFYHNPNGSVSLGFLLKYKNQLIISF